MLHRIVSILFRSPAYPPFGTEKQRTEFLTDQFQLFALVAQPVYTLVFLFTGRWPLTLLSLGLVGVTAITWGIARKVSFDMGRRLFALSIPVNLAVLAMATGPEAGLQWLLLPALFVPSLAYPARQLTGLWWAVLLTLGAFAFLEFGPSLLAVEDQLPSIVNRGLYLFNFIVSVLLILSGLNWLVLTYRKSRHTLQLGELHNRALLNALPDTMIRMQGNGNLLDYKPGNIELSEDTDRIMGNSIFDLLPPEVCDKFAEAMSQSLASNQLQTLEYTSKREVQEECYEVRLVPAGPNELICILRDISDKKRIEQSLLRSEANLQALFNSSIQSYVLLDKNQRIVIFNERAGTNYRNYLQRDLQLDIAMPELLPESEQKAFHLQFQQALAGKPTKSMQKVEHNGTDHWFEIDFLPSRDSKGNIFGVSIITLEVTERKNYEERLKRKEEEASKLALVASLTDNSVVITDNKGRIEWVNKAFESMTDYTLEEVKGHKPGDLLQGEATDQATVLFMRECLMLGNPFQVEILNYSKSGRLYWLEIESQPLLDETGKIKQFFAIQRDITQQKEYENSLKAARDIAEAAANAKSEFMSNMSHEIRTPMNAIIGLTDLLLEKPLEEESIGSLKRISYSAKNLLTLINDILDFSKIEAGKLPIEFINFNIRQLFNEHIQSIDLKAEEKGLRLLHSVDSEIPSFLVSDPLRLNQVLLNLTSNAIKFTDSGTVSLSIHLLERDDDKVKLRFSVEDTGIGIRPEKLETIFDSFTQADVNITRKYGGTGLGLSITKKLIELQGGTITVDSEIGQGSTFTFELPFRVSESSKLTVVKPEEEPSTRELSGRKMLLVEDNLINQFVAEQLLKSWEIEVEKAMNGLEAVEILKTAQFDAILMDIQMPEMDGFGATQVIRDLQSDILDHAVPIIAVSADVFPETQEKAVRVGMNDFITKPIDQDELYQVLLKNCREMPNIDSAEAHEAQQPEKEATLPMSDPHSQGILNLDFIKENISDDPDFIRELLQIFKASNGVDMKEFTAASESDDLARLRGISHKLKSSFRSVGLAETASILESIEKKAKDGIVPDNLEDKVRRVQEHFQQASEEIDRFE